MARTPPEPAGRELTMPQRVITVVAVLALLGLVGTLLIYLVPLG